MMPPQGPPQSLQFDAPAAGQQQVQFDAPAQGDVPPKQSTPPVEESLMHRVGRYASYATGVDENALTQIPPSIAKVGSAVYHGVAPMVKEAAGVSTPNIAYQMYKHSQGQPNNLAEIPGKAAKFLAETAIAPALAETLAPAAPIEGMPEGEVLPPEPVVARPKALKSGVYQQPGIVPGRQLALPEHGSAIPLPSASGPTASGAPTAQPIIRTSVTEPIARPTTGGMPGVGTAGAETAYRQSLTNASNADLIRQAQKLRLTLSPDEYNLAKSGEKYSAAGRKALVEKIIDATPAGDQVEAARTLSLRGK